MNWREGFRRIAKIIGWCWIAASVLIVLATWQNGMTTYDRVWSVSRWDWSRFQHAFGEAFGTLVGCVVVYFIGVAIVRGVGWVWAGFAKGT